MRRLAVTIAVLLAAVACSEDPATVSSTGSEATETTESGDVAEDTVAADGAGDVGASDASTSDEELCSALSVIVDLNEEMGVAMQPIESKMATEGVEAQIGVEAQAVADQLESGRSDIERAYADAVEASEGEMRSDLEAVAETTALLVEPMVDVLRETEDVGDLGAMEDIFDDEALAQSAIDGAQAALRVDEFAIPTCGFRFSNT